MQVVSTTVLNMMDSETPSMWAYSLPYGSLEMLPVQYSTVQYSQSNPADVSCVALPYHVSLPTYSIYQPPCTKPISTLEIQNVKRGTSNMQEPTKRCDSLDPFIVGFQKVKDCITQWQINRDEVKNNRKNHPHQLNPQTTVSKGWLKSSSCCMTVIFLPTLRHGS